MAKQVYGRIKDKKDKRDFVFKVAKVVKTTLPSSVDLAPSFAPVYDQSTLGSCVGNSVSGTVQYVSVKQGEKTFAHQMPSRLFAYFNARVLDGDPVGDNGASIRNGIKGVATWGLCQAQDWPYILSNVSVKPPVGAYNVAKKETAIKYMAVVQNEQSIKGALAMGNPIVFGINVFESFESDAVAANGIVTMPTVDEKFLGGHAIVLVGYDDATKLFKFRNSWGEGWGSKGYGFLPYDYVLNTKFVSNDPNAPTGADSALASDLWVIQKLA